MHWNRSDSSRGGVGHGDKDETLRTVEVLNTVTRQWHIALDLLEPLSQSSVTLCGDFVYLLGGVDKDDESTNSVYCCSLSSLPLSTGSKSQGLGHLVSTQMQSSHGSIMWNRVADLPAVTFHGQLLAIGGWDLQKSSTAIHMYQPTTNSWEVISHLTTPRNVCLAAILPDNQLMVIGGYTTGDKLSLSDSVEFGRV